MDEISFGPYSQDKSMKTADHPWVEIGKATGISNKNRDC